MTFLSRSMWLAILVLGLRPALAAEQAREPLLVFAAASLVLTVPAFLIAQAIETPAPGTVSAEAVRTETAPELDGNVLDDKAWAGAKVITMALSEAQVIGSSSQFNVDWGNMSAVAILATVPVFIITLIFQRQIVEGITSGVFK